ncbi:Bgt-1599 [Blumeria graminis f. sp. tritici]|uniref:Bgt-1599 n=2 Tax=Blumeria graminis f. sp. tritici TaxID=62690 RepID=A0A9X9PQH0_BLUGR|nr:hypothetical protein BGT96224_1599 [Blumeria graminis f. sp. tritici 96224]VCU38948.1 Bgt-1599 [Blumeria graminis f. sp. tritici]
MASWNPVFEPGKTAVITGAASGIGLALARKCAGYGMNVIMVDIDAANLAAAKATMTGPVETVTMDVGKIEDYQALQCKITAEYKGTISLLVLNAGIAQKSNWADSSYFENVLQVNLFGIIYGLNSLLPLVTRSSSVEAPAAIVMTGSKQGITNPPGNPAYNASKAAVKALAEHLAFDLSKLSPTTSVHLLVPGWTFTGMTGSAPRQDVTASRREKPAGAWMPEQVVEYLEAKMREKKFYIICPDNDVNERLDQARISWATNDLVLGRPPLTRWREEWKNESEEWIRHAQFPDPNAAHETQG